MFDSIMSPKKVEKNGFFYVMSGDSPREGEWAYHPIDGWIGQWVSTCPMAHFFFKIIETNDPKIILN